MKFKLLKNKEKSHKNTANLNSAINERTREKFILKGWIESNRKPTCTKNGTRGFLFGAQTRFKMDFSAGRSMVEMLGVLAIIGVLSIGGITGYTIAMRRYRANEILNIINKYAMILYSNCQQAVLDDPDHYQIDFKNETNCPLHINDIEYHNHSGNHFLIPFQDSGLGALPNGLLGIYSTDSRLPFASPYLKKSQSGDLLILYAILETEELCKTVLTSAGTVPLSENSHGNCEYYKDPTGDYATKAGYWALVSFIMN